jgi:hypothetical protein
MGKKRENLLSKKDFLSENSKKCIDYEKNSFDPNAIPKEPNAYLKLVSLKLEHRDEGLTQVPLRYKDATSVTALEACTGFETIPVILFENESTYSRRV